MKDESKQFEIRLPARITGLVFWGLVFIGLFVAVFILQNSEQKLADKNRKESSLIAYELESIIEQHATDAVLQNAGAHIRSKLSEYISDQGFHAIRLYEGSDMLSIGAIGESDDLYTHELKYFPVDGTELETLNLELYTTSSKEIVDNLRKQILLSIGIGVFIFGLLLQRILQKMLAMPFQRMVNTAEKFTQGDAEARFDEERPDEFGYLGKFINNAIDSILNSKYEAEQALERASASEAALVIEKEHAEVTLSSITDTVVTVNIDEEIVYVNPAGEALLNIKESDYLRKPFKEVFSIVKENSGLIIDDPLQKCFETGGILHLPEHSSLIAHDDSMISIEASIAPM
jgi:PAS domain-containing protein